MVCRLCVAIFASFRLKRLERFPDKSLVVVAKAALEYSVHVLTLRSTFGETSFVRMRVLSALSEFKFSF